MLVSAAVGLATVLTWTVNAQAKSPWYLEGSAGGCFRQPESGAAEFFRTAGEVALDSRGSRAASTPSTISRRFGGRFTPYVGGGIGLSADHRTKGAFAGAAGQTVTSGSDDMSTEGFGLLEAAERRQHLAIDITVSACHS